MRVERRSLRTPVGVLVVSADDLGVVAINRAGRPVSRRGSAAARRHAVVAVRQLREYFAGTRRSFTVPLHLEGTDFQRRAWEVMRTIPFGETMTYGGQARAMRSPRAARAVGGANGANPVPIIVPCHRVVAGDGSLGGYALGSTMKKWLLRHESR